MLVFGINIQKEEITKNRSDEIGKTVYVKRNSFQQANLLKEMFWLVCCVLSGYLPSLQEFITGCNVFYDGSFNVHKCTIRERSIMAGLEGDITE